MKESNNQYDWLGMMLHFADSALPVGTYAHSFGLEGLCQLGVISDEPSLREFLLRDVLHSLQSVDLPLMVRAYDAVQLNDREAVRKWDSEARALRPTRQLRTSAEKAGRQTWMLFEKTWMDDSCVLNKDWFPCYQSAVVSGAIFSARGIPREAVLRVGAYQVYSAILQSALKLLPIGPSAAQALLSDSMMKIEGVYAHVLELEDEELGSFNPLWDIAASRHERAEARLFIS